MKNDKLQLAKNIVFQFRYLLLAIGLCLLVTIVCGTFVAGRKVLLEANERQAAAKSRKDAEANAKQMALKNESLVRQHLINQKSLLEEAEANRKAALLEAKVAGEEKERKAEQLRVVDQARQQAEANERRLVVEKEKKEYIAKYLRAKNAIKSAGMTSVAIGIANAKQKFDEPFAARLSTLFDSKRIKASGGIFTSAFAVDGVLERILQSEANEIDKLDLASMTDNVLLGTYLVEFSTSIDLQNLVTARIHLGIGVVRTESGVLVESFTLDATGAGFANDSAEAAAKDQLFNSLKKQPWVFLKQ